MFFFFRPSTITIDFFTDMPHAFHHAKPIPAIESIPPWWRQLPKNKPDFGGDLKSMRYCPGFTNLYKRGFVIPLWSDLLLSIAGTSSGDYEYKYQFADLHGSLEAHQPNQWGDFYRPDTYQNIKLVNPWMAKTKSKEPFLMTDLTYSRNTQNQFFVANGVLDFHQYITPNVHLFFIRTASTKEHFLKHGEPLAHVIPLSDKKVKIKTHLIETEEKLKMEKYAHMRLKFVNNYNYLKRMIK